MKPDLDRTPAEIAANMKAIAEAHHVAMLAPTDYRAVTILEQDLSTETECLLTARVTNLEDLAALADFAQRMLHNNIKTVDRGDETLISAAHGAIARIGEALRAVLPEAPPDKLKLN